MRVDVLVDSVIRVMPLYFSNLMPPMAFGRIPLDLGRKIRGRRVLGDGKTVEGAVVGMLGGVFAASVVNLSGSFSFGLGTAAVMSLFAIIGDITGSFFKRRLGMRRGDPFPGMDQLGFVVFGMLPVNHILGLSPVQVLIILIITPPLHLLSNWAGYFMGIKREPW